jgi:hypothetical protein
MFGYNPKPSSRVAYKIMIQTLQRFIQWCYTETRNKTRSIFFCTSYRIRTDTFVCTNRLAVNALPYFTSCVFRCFCKFYSLASASLTTSSNHSMVTTNFYHSTSFCAKEAFEPRYNPRVARMTN